MTCVAELPVPYSTDRPPGFLLEPFRWVIPRLIAILHDQPGYLPDLIHLSQTRMHLIGVALAHLQTDPGADLAGLLFRGPAETLLEFSVGRQPPGLKRAVRIMPNYMMEAESYRALVRLLDEPQAARFFHHAPEIRDSTIRAMSDVPVELRAALFCLHENIVDMSSFSEGLRLIARRSGRLTFDGLVAELARARQPQQLVARLKSFVDTLPLPDALPRRACSMQHASTPVVSSASSGRSGAIAWRATYGMLSMASARFISGDMRACRLSARLPDPVASAGFSIRSRVLRTPMSDLLTWRLSRPPSGLRELSPNQLSARSHRSWHLMVCGEGVDDIIA